MHQPSISLGVSIEIVNLNPSQLRGGVSFRLHHFAQGCLDKKIDVEFHISLNEF